MYAFNMLPSSFIQDRSQIPVDMVRFSNVLPPPTKTCCLSEGFFGVRKYQNVVKQMFTPLIAIATDHGQIYKISVNSPLHFILSTKGVALQCAVTLTKGLNQGGTSFL